MALRSRRSEVDPHLPRGPRSSPTDSVAMIKEAGDMRLASKVIILVRDSDGFGPALSEALQPNPNSGVSREVSAFELSLERYGITDRNASGDLIQFLDPHGSPQVSVLVLPNYGPPVAACAANEVLASIRSSNSSIILPFFVAAEKITWALPSHRLPEQEVKLYGIELGNTTDLTSDMLAGISRPPTSLRIHCELLTCLMLMVRVLKMPTVLLIGSNSQHHSVKDTDPELEALYKLGEFLSNRVGLEFSKDRVCRKQIEKSKDTKKPWQALYG